jgi:hypothetical protein
MGLICLSSGGSQLRGRGAYTMPADVGLYRNGKKLSVRRQRVRAARREIFW